MSKKETITLSFRYKIESYSKQNRNELIRETVAFIKGFKIFGDASERYGIECTGQIKKKKGSHSWNQKPLNA